MVIPSLAPLADPSVGAVAGTSVGLGAAALAMARLTGLCAAGPLLSDPELSRGLRVGFIAVIGAALAPLRLDEAAALLPTPSAFATALAAELAFGLCIGAAARLTLSAAGVAGQLAGISLGLGLAEQYDPQRGEPAIAGQRLARTATDLAFVGAGGLDALVRAAATPLANADLAGAAAYALRMATDAAGLGLGLAAPLLLAALLTNLALALAHRAAVAINLFTVGLAATLLTVGATALVTAPQLTHGLQLLVQRAVLALVEGSPL